MFRLRLLHAGGVGQNPVVHGIPGQRDFRLAVFLKADLQLAAIGLIHPFAQTALAGRLEAGAGEDRLVERVTQLLVALGHGANPSCAQTEVLERDYVVVANRFRRCNNTQRMSSGYIAR